MGQAIYVNNIITKDSMAWTEQGLDESKNLIQMNKDICFTTDF